VLSGRKAKQKFSEYIHLFILLYHKKIKKRELGLNALKGKTKSGGI